MSEEIAGTGARIPPPLTSPCRMAVVVVVVVVVVVAVDVAAAAAAANVVPWLRMPTGRVGGQTIHHWSRAGIWPRIFIFKKCGTQPVRPDVSQRVSHVGTESARSSSKGRFMIPCGMMVLTSPSLLSSCFICLPQSKPSAATNSVRSCFVGWAKVAASAGLAEAFRGVAISSVFQKKPSCCMFLQDGCSAEMRCLIKVHCSVY